MAQFMQGRQTRKKADAQAAVADCAPGPVAAHVNLR